MKTQNSTSLNESQSILFKKPDNFSVAQKKELKKNLLQMFGFKKNQKNLLIGFEIDKTDTNHNYILEHILEGLSQLPVNVLILGKRKSHCSEYKNIKYAASSNQNKELIQSGVDIFALPSNYAFENSCLQYGTPCIYLDKNMYSGHLNEFKPLEESGNGIICRKESSWILFASVVRALETYKFSYDWQTMCKNAFDTGQGVS